MICTTGVLAKNALLREPSLPKNSYTLRDMIGRVIRRFLSSVFVLIAFNYSHSSPSRCSLYLTNSDISMMMGQSNQLSGDLACFSTPSTPDLPRMCGQTVL